MQRNIIQSASPTKLSAETVVGFRDLGFQTRSVLCHSSGGTPYETKVSFGMPRIPPKTLNTVGYLYHDGDDAEKGADFGGTAFFVAIDSTIPNRKFIYAVTNWHVAVRDGASVLRVNNIEGVGDATDIWNFGPENWFFDPRYDIAVVPLQLRSERHIFSVLPAPDALVMSDNIKRAKLEPGEDVFMVGRFIDHDGGTINRPAVRFGNISVMPAPIEQPNGLMADAYCIDLHSRSGYSGSAVFVYRTPGYDLEQIGPKDFKEAKLLFAGANYLALLGIHFAQFPEQWEIGREAAPATQSSVPLVKTGQYVKGLSGMTCVLPAWYIWEVLNLPELKRQREEADARIRAEMIAKGEMPPEAEGASAPTVEESEENPQHLKDFRRLVDVAARKRPQGDQT